MPAQMKSSNFSFSPFKHIPIEHIFSFGNASLPTIPTMRSFPKNKRKSVTLSKTATLRSKHTFYITNPSGGLRGLCRFKLTWWCSSWEEKKHLELRYRNFSRKLQSGGGGGGGWGNQTTKQFRWLKTPRADVCPAAELTMMYAFLLRNLMHFSRHQKQHFMQLNRNLANLFWAPGKHEGSHR